VIQLDDKPWETGWMLECDEGIIERADPGTYGIISSRPIFRIEFETVVTSGSECQLTVVDTGNDGLNPNLYQVYISSREGQSLEASPR